MKDMQKLLVRVMKCSGSDMAWYSDRIGQHFEVYLERDIYLYIDDTETQRFVIAEDQDNGGRAGWRGLDQCDCTIIGILPLSEAAIKNQQYQKSLAVFTD